MSNSERDSRGFRCVLAITGFLCFAHSAPGQECVLSNFKLLPSDGPGNDAGSAAAIDGDTAAIGSSGDHDLAEFSGAVYVFIGPDTPWVEQAKLKAGDPESFDHLGHSVAVDGDTLVAGAFGDDDGGANAGSAYVFVRNAGVWSQQAKLTAADAGADDQFGGSVGISGDTVIVGSRNDDDVAPNSGAAYVFVRSGTVWSQQAKLKASDSNASDFFGESVSIDGETALIGTPDDDEAAGGAGGAYVFTRSAGVWSQTAKLIAGDAAAGDKFGTAVSLDADSAIIGAPFDDGVDFNHGSAYVFVRTGPASWIQQAKLTAFDAERDDYLGESVAIRGDAAVVGAPSHWDHRGAAYSFIRSSGIWTSGARIVGSDINVVGTRIFAQSVSMTGTMVLAGELTAAYVVDLTAPGSTTDCNNNSLGDACEIAGCEDGDSICRDCDRDGTIDACGSCTDPCHCPDGNACTDDVCALGVCSHPVVLYGDANRDGFVDIFDILCVLDGFAGVFDYCAANAVDLVPCNAQDGIVDTFDILFVLDAFAGVDFCNCPGGP
ncbi:MAG: hypothetical protein HOP29_00085 [Phycisphaerales bacterium]|nr:hypothetical protein [Phycisphaerales bacterium]